MSDPVWLPDVLRNAGLRCDIFPGAFERGHGDFGNIWGVVCHHTGSFGETPNGIANHPSLGLASQLFLHRDGYYVLCGVGVAWHAGSGSWPGLPTNGANQYTIGIEAQNDGGGTPGKPHHVPWSDAQYDAYTRGVAAIMNQLAENAGHVLGHKDWAGPAQGKWDPGGIDMPTMRRDITENMLGAEDDMFNDDDRNMLRTVRDELTKRFPSRAWCRDSDNQLETLAGYSLWTNGTGYDSFVADSAKAGQQWAKDTLQRLATGKLPEQDPNALSWAKGILDSLKAV